jgi:hypothetical protein
MRARHAAGMRIQRAKQPEFHSLELVLGIRIDGSPVIAGHPDAADQPTGQPGTSPGAQPGALLPHAWLGPGRSLYDELGEGFTLIRRAGTGTGTGTGTGGGTSGGGSPRPGRAAAHSRPAWTARSRARAGPARSVRGVGRGP